MEYRVVLNSYYSLGHVSIWSRQQAFMCQALFMSAAEAAAAAAACVARAPLTRSQCRPRATLTFKLTSGAPLHKFTSKPTEQMYLRSQSKWQKAPLVILRWQLHSAFREGKCAKERLNLQYKRQSHCTNGTCWGRQKDAVLFILFYLSFTNHLNSILIRK